MMDTRDTWSTLGGSDSCHMWRTGMLHQTCWDPTHRWQFERSTSSCKCAKGARNGGSSFWRRKGRWMTPPQHSLSQLVTRSWEHSPKYLNSSLLAGPCIVLPCIPAPLAQQQLPLLPRRQRVALPTTIPAELPHWIQRAGSGELLASVDRSGTIHRQGKRWPQPQPTNSNRGSTTKKTQALVSKESQASGHHRTCFAWSHYLLDF